MSTPLILTLCICIHGYYYFIFFIIGISYFEIPRITYSIDCFLSLFDFWALAIWPLAFDSGVGKWKPSSGSCKLSIFILYITAILFCRRDDVQQDKTHRISLQRWRHHDRWGADWDLLLLRSLWVILLFYIKKIIIILHHERSSSCLSLTYNESAYHMVDCCYWWDEPCLTQKEAIIHPFGFSPLKHSQVSFSLRSDDQVSSFWLLVHTSGETSTHLWDYLQMFSFGYGLCT